MNREIKFRGQRIDNKEWVCGFFVGNYNPSKVENEVQDYFIYEGLKNLSNLIPVIPESVGQFIEEKDESGKEIYEDDIVDICVFLVSPSNPDYDEHYRGVISFEGGWMFNIVSYIDYRNGGTVIPIQSKHLPFYEAELDEDGTFSVSLFAFMGLSGNLGEFLDDNIKIIGSIHETPSFLTK